MPNPSGGGTAQLKKKKQPGKSVEDAMAGRVTFTTVKDFAAFEATARAAGALAVVLEAAPETLALKRSIFKEVGLLRRPYAVPSSRILPVPYEDIHPWLWLAPAAGAGGDP